MNKYYDEDFIGFSNVTIFTRSGDNRGGAIIFAHDDLHEKLNDGPYIIDINQGRIIETSCKLMKDTINVDRRKLERLALKYLTYPVSFLSVDSNSNAYFSLYPNKRPDLVRFSDVKFISGTYKTDWRQIRGNWYEKSE